MIFHVAKGGIINMKYTLSYAGMVTLILAGCSSTPQTGNTALGITGFEVTQSDSELRIVGLDAKKAIVGEVHLTLGYVAVPDYGMEGQGRSLTVDVRGIRAEHKSVGFDPLRLPLFKSGGEGLNAFLQDPSVAPLLAKWGVNFTKENAIKSRRSSEVAYSGCRHDWPASCGNFGCCAYNQSGSATEYEDGCCSGQSAMDNRACNDCTSGCRGTSTACGNAGDSGCAGCWYYSYNQTCQIYDLGSTCDYYVYSCIQDNDSGCDTYPCCDSQTDCTGNVCVPIP
jgi:hypothetical protein